MVYQYSSFVYMGIFAEVPEGWWMGGSEKQLLDGYIYPDSDFTEWKLVVPNVCISNFMTIPSSVNFLRPMLVLAVKVRLPRLKKSQQGTFNLYSQN